MCGKMETWDNKEEILKLKKKISGIGDTIEALEETLTTMDNEIKELINMENITSEVVDKILTYLENDYDVNKEQRRNIPKKGTRKKTVDVPDKK